MYKYSMPTAKVAYVVDEPSVFIALSIINAMRTVIVACVVVTFFRFAVASRT